MAGCAAVFVFWFIPHESMLVDEKDPAARSLHS
jgi:hypothetical protein